MNRKKRFNREKQKHKREERRLETIKMNKEDERFKAMILEHAHKARDWIRDECERRRQQWSQDDESDNDPDVDEIVARVINESFLDLDSYPRMVIDHETLKYVLKPVEPPPPPPTELTVFALNYNILRISKGYSDPF